VIRREPGSGRRLVGIKRDKNVDGLNGPEHGPQGQTIIIPCGIQPFGFPWWHWFFPVDGFGAPPRHSARRHNV
jgi:hypothetical protein